MSAQILLRLRSIFASASLTLFVAGCVIQASEPAHPEAGDVVPPRRASAAAGAGTSTPSLYEYSDTDRYVTTGKRIRFRVDNLFLEAADRSDGPKFNISLMYDVETLGRSTLERSRHIVSATLESQANRRHWTPEDIMSAQMSFGLPDLEPGDATWRGSECGLDAYDVAQSEYTTRTIARYGLTRRAAEFRSRWGGSMLFALRDEGGDYRDVIACYQKNPTCTARTTYRSWPLRLTFPNDRICDYPKIVADARRMFDRFYLDETERSPGQVERRWLP